MVLEHLGKTVIVKIVNRPMSDNDVLVYLEEAT
jgi:hypothetical protein